MTQRLSSFYLYLVDLWRRCFAKEYWVKAGGNSETKHDFRICPECGVRVISLNPCWRVERCENEACIAILHKKGEYIRKERQFHLEKPLYSKFFAGLYIIISVCALTCLAILRLRIVPDGYEPMWWNGLPAYLLAISVFFYAMTHIFFSERLVRFKKLGELFIVFFIVGLSIVIVLIVYLGTGRYTDGKILAPFWIDIPTQEDLYAQQYAILESMPLNAKRFEFADSFLVKNNPLVRLPEEFVKIAKEDFSNLVRSRILFPLRLVDGSQEQKDFYGFYGGYLSSLNVEYLGQQCQFDPWNLATIQTVQRYPETWSACPK